MFVALCFELLHIVRTAQKEPLGGNKRPQAEQRPSRRIAAVQDYKEKKTASCQKQDRQKAAAYQEEIKDIPLEKITGVLYHLHQKYLRLRVGIEFFAYLNLSCVNTLSDVKFLKFLNCFL